MGKKKHKPFRYPSSNPIVSSIPPNQPPNQMPARAPGSQGVIQEVTFHHEQVIARKIPTPEELKKYQEILPDSPKIIFEMAQHEQNLKYMAIQTYSKDLRHGRWFGIVALLFILAATVFCVRSGALTVAGILAGVLAMTVGYFVLGNIKSTAKQQNVNQPK